MRCKACNNMLSDAESRRKDPQTKDFTDLCGSCLVVSDATVEGWYLDDNTETVEINVDYDL